MAGGWDQMIIYLGYTQKKNVISSVRTLAILMVYTSIEGEKDYFEDQIIEI